MVQPPGASKENSSLLDEFVTTESKKNGIFDAHILLSGLYIAFVLFTICIDYKMFSLRSIKWLNLLFVLLLPVLGLGFQLAGKKVGWIISFFYFSLVVLSFLSALLINCFYDGQDLDIKGNWQLLLVLIL